MSIDGVAIFVWDIWLAVARLNKHTRDRVLDIVNPAGYENFRHQSDMTATVSEDRNMSYVFLGNSGLKVSNVNLGCMTFGEAVRGLPGQCDEDLSHQILNRYVEWGGNFLDTADVYGLGVSESIVGRWLETKPREQVVIATKCRRSMGVEHNVNNVGATRRHITESIDGSLRRLHTDFVDLYQIHSWDDGTPLEESLRTMDDLVRAGKVRYVGVSNFSGWQLEKLVNVTKRLGLNPVISLQQQYSLACRESERESFQVCKSAGIGVLPYSPLKGGLLTGKFSRGVKPTEGRVGWQVQGNTHAIDLSERVFDIIDTAGEIAKRHGRSIPQVAVRWLLQKDVVSSVIIGARTLAQLDDNMGVNGWSLSQDEMQQLDEVSSPQLPYPYKSESRIARDDFNPYIRDVFVRSTW